MDTFSIPVIYRNKKTDLGTRVLLPLKDLLYVRVIGKHLYFFASNSKEYLLQASLADWKILLDGLDFEEVDRGTLANFRRVSYIYSDLQQIHFTAEIKGLFCPIAAAHISRIQRTYPNISVRKSGAL